MKSPPFGGLFVAVERKKLSQATKMRFFALNLM